MSTKAALILLLLITASVYLYAATSRAILDDGDALYATVALQMADHGDWVTPSVYGVRFLDKPPMMYWLMASSYLTLGRNEFAARLPSALAVIGTSCLVFWMAASSVGAVPGLFAGLASALCVGTFLFTRMVFPDMLLVFFITLAVSAFWRWYRDPRGPAFPALMFYIAVGGAVLTKGIVGALFPTATVILFLLWSRQFIRLRHFHIGKGVLVFSSVALPWHVLAAARTPGFLWYYFVNEHFLRFLGRRLPADYDSIALPVFWILCLVWFFPWCAFLPAIRDTYRQSIGAEVRPLMRLSLCWAGVILTFFTVSSRIEHYSLPLIPPAALLIGMTLAPAGSGRLREGASRWVTRGFAALAAFGVLAGMASVFALASWSGDRNAGEPLAARHVRAYEFYFAPVFDLPPAMREGLRAPFIGTCAVLALGFAAAWWANRRNRRIRAVMLLVSVMAAFDFFAFQSLGICEDAISSHQFGQELSRLYRGGDSVITLGDYETANSLNFYVPMPLDIYQGTAAVLSWGLRYPDAPRRILSAADFESRWYGPTRTFLLVPDRRLSDLHLRRSFEVLRSAGRSLICNSPF